MKPCTALVELTCASLLALLLASPAEAQDQARPDAMFLEPPVLQPNENPNTPLAASIRYVTAKPTRTELRIYDGSRSWTVEPEPECVQVHDVLLLGARADRAHEITVSVFDQNGGSWKARDPLVFVTPPLPADFAPLHVITSEPDQMEDGVTVFDAVSSRETDSFIVMVDAEGEVVWYFRTPHHVGAIQQLRNGNLLYMYDRVSIVEIDMLGNVVQEWYAAALGTKGAPEGAVLVDVNAFHHDVIELPEGMAADFMALSVEMRAYPSYPTDEVEREMVLRSANVVGDVVVAFKRDGEVVGEHAILDLIDPYRVCYDSMHDFWDPFFGTRTFDWSHGNAIVYDPADDSILYSARHQEAVIKFGRTSNQLKWILGTRALWGPEFAARVLRPTGVDLQWNYHQHGAKLTSNGTVIMFDNGNFRATPPDAPMPHNRSYSRAVEYQVDEAAGTAAQVWAFGGPAGGGSFFSPAYGDVDLLPKTGNVLVTDANRQAGDTYPVGWARILELTHTGSPAVVLELHLVDLDGAPPQSWSLYRSERLKSLYPGS